MLDSLYYAAWSVWMPTYFVYLVWLFGGHEASATIVIASALLFTFLFELPTGAVADSLKGERTFFLTAALMLAVHIGYAFLVPMLGVELRLGTVVLFELVAGMATALLSGSFDRWYQGTMEMVGLDQSPSELFSELKWVRWVSSGVGGAVGIWWYSKMDSLVVTPEAYWLQPKAWVLQPSHLGGRGTRGSAGPLLPCAAGSSRVSTCCGSRDAERARPSAKSSCGGSSARTRPSVRRGACSVARRCWCRPRCCTRPTCSSCRLPPSTSLYTSGVWASWAPTRAAGVLSRS